MSRYLLAKYSPDLHQRLALKIGVEVEEVLSQPWDGFN
jgi:hypothetical protein